MKKQRGLLSIIMLAVLLFGCSDSVPLFDEMSKGRSDKLERIEIYPDDIILDDASYCMLTATGYYNDGSSDDITTKCEWTSDDPNKAVVSAGGYVQARTLNGKANISARYDTLGSDSKITIDIRLTKIDLTPVEKILDSDNQVSLTATGITSDGAALDLTKTVTWSVDPLTKGSVNDAGLFTANDVTGTVTVKAVSPDGSISSNGSIITLQLTELFVDASYPAGAGDGTKLKPYSKIRDAIEKATLVGAVRINVAKGTYVENLIIDRNVSLYGGYNRAGGNWTRDATVIPADTEIRANGNIAILYSGGLTEATVLDGFRITGGTGTSATSNGIYCSGASPLITHNEIFGGSSTGVSVGILVQTSSPVIKDNPVVSGGLPGYTGGGADNFAILCQSFSNPVIEGNGSESASSQIITGPAGGESTYRIKCESSSNAIIKYNKIETTIGGSVGFARGIFAISSSPLIEGNTIESAATSNLVIRGENTSSQIKGNSIGGSIYITSGSMNTVIDENKIIKGDITITGASTGVAIRNHVITDPEDVNYKTHYGRSSTKIIEGQITCDGSSTGMVENNVVKQIYIKGAGYLLVRNNIILMGNGTALYVNNGSAYIIGNYIQSFDDESSNDMHGIYIGHTGGITGITNNIIYAYNVNETSTGTLYGVVILDMTGTTALKNNLLCLEKPNSSTYRSVGIIISEMNADRSSRLYNNIIYMRGGTGNRNGIYLQDATIIPRFVVSNYFVNCNYTVNGAVQYTDSTALNGRDGVGGYYDLNTDVLFNPSTDPTFLAAKWKNFDTTRIGEAFINNDFRLNASSVFVNKGQSPKDFPSYESDCVYISPDFNGTVRTNASGDLVTGEFEVGPYEYIP